MAAHGAAGRAGGGSMMGRSPFHDEKSPSFHVRPQVGLYHCFGCGQGGDVIDFVQKIDHLSFTEAVERLAARAGVELRYEDDAGGRAQVRRDQVGQRQRLIEANRVAAQFFAEQLAAPDAQPGRQFLTGRGFDRAAAELFGVGFAPRGGEVLLRHLRGRGFTEDELVASGVAGRGQRGLYDRFRGRLIWPIRDVTGDVVGFGARRLFDDDGIEAKYLNTPETAIYKKSQVLYGVDLAKRDISRKRELIVVEGYTDVMACHLAGETTAVATCGTAFGADHIRIARRLIGDDTRAGGRVVFTFDGDEAGQKAAIRAFDEDQRFVAQTFIAVARDGMDPCDLRLKHGDEAVRQLIATRQPLFAFAIRSVVDQVDLSTAEGRVLALRTAAPVVAQIRDPALRPEYARQLAGWLGMEVEPVIAAVRATAKATTQMTAVSQPPAAANPSDPIARTEAQVLACLLQVPRLVPAADADALNRSAFTVPAYAAVHDAIRAAGGMAVADGLPGVAWVESVRQNASEPVQGMITRLAVAPLPADSDEMLARYASSMVLALAEVELVRRIGDLRSQVQRAGDDAGQALDVLKRLMDAEASLASIRQRKYGT